ASLLGRSCHNPLQEWRVRQIRCPPMELQTARPQSGIPQSVGYRVPLVAPSSKPRARCEWWLMEQANLHAIAELLQEESTWLAAPPGTATPLRPAGLRRATLAPLTQKLALSRRPHPASTDRRDRRGTPPTMD